MPPTVVAVKWASTHALICASSVDAPPPPTPPAPRPPKPPAPAAARDVIVDLVLGDELLELREAGRRVGAAEAADRHHRDTAGGKLHRGGAVGAIRRRRPLVMGRARLEQFGERAADRRVAAARTAEAARGPARAAVTEPAGESAAAAAEPR